jgi:hypothetical protein
MTPWEPEPDFAGFTVAICATGPSFSAELAEQIRASGVMAVAINDNYRLMPWADWLFAADMKWWNVHNDARKFKGRKICSQETAEERDMLIYLPRDKGPGRNTSLHAAWAAIDAKAVKLLLFGVDLDETDPQTHWFGDHPPELARPSSFTFARHAWGRLAERGDRPPILNCSPRSALRCFPFADAVEELSRQ